MVIVSSTRDPYPDLSSTPAPPLRNSTSAWCFVWGDSSYRTFDGSQFAFCGHCSYQLFADLHGDQFQATLHNPDAGCNATACSRRLTIQVGSVRLELSNRQRLDYSLNCGRHDVCANLRSSSMPFAASNLEVTRTGPWVLVRSSLGFQIRWDGGMYVQAELDGRYKQRTGGLCGRYSDDVRDDFTTPGGDLAATPEEFGRSWALQDRDDVCHRGSRCPDTCPTDTRDQARSMCQRLLLQDSAFKHCQRDVSAIDYIEACVREFCDCDPATAANSPENCVCNSLQAYAEHCKIEKQQPINWRTDTRCPYNCTNGRQYDICGESCSRTCNQRVTNCDMEYCIEGCVCPRGQLWDEHGQRCVVERDCPCEHGGQFYPPGSELRQACQLCRCQGDWVCQDEQCLAVCHAVGEVHLSHGEAEIANSSLSIDVTNQQCSFSSKVACVGSVDIRRGSERIFVNRDISSEFSLMINSHTFDSSKAYFESKEFAVFVMQNAVVVKPRGGPVIAVTRRGQLYVHAATDLKGRRLRGLCGTYDGNKNTDFLKPDGDIDDVPTSFMRSWKQEKTCKDNAEVEVPNSCDLNPARYQQVQTLCREMRDKLIGGLFGNCLSGGEREHFAQMCQSDLCACTKSDESCLCGLYNHIGHMCSARKIVVDWKKELPECGASCPSGMVWKPCVDYCKYSCSALSLGNRCDSSDVCVAGCVCPNGQVQHEGRCVSVSECKCEFDGRDFPPGTSVSKGNETCECNYGEWHCKPGPCPGCDSICPQGKEYTPCRSNCPATCATGLGGVGCNQTCDRDGCQCPPGMVEDDKGECKRPEDCTCSHNGKDYKEGDVIQHPSCIDCVCKRSKWDCNRRPSCASMCSVWGLGHFETFDGAQYSVKGRCEYVLTQSADWEAGGSIDRMRFRILASFTSCSTSGATCIGYVMVQYKLAKSFLLKSFAMRSRNMIWEDAQSSITHDHGTVLRHTTDKLFSIVHLVDIGVTVYFDQQSRVYISLDDRHRENVRGLCGTFDNDQKTDFVGPASNMIIDRVPEFVDKWKTRAACPNAELLVDNCDAVKDRETWAKTRCKEVLLDHVNISKCHAMVDPMPFYENCVQDSCLCDKGGDCECFCANVAHYVQKCNQVGVHVHWRSQTICPMQCDEDCDHVTPCKSVCPPKTCLNKDRHDELLRDTACQDLMCIEGCESEPCPPGTVLHEGKCVNESICECTCRFNGRDYGEGERITDPEVCDPCQNCFCGCNNTLVKTGDPCTTSGPSTVSTATPATPFPPLCDTTGWTRWMNASSPISGDGDYEIIPNLRRHYQFCEVDDISKVDYKALEPVDPAEVDKQVKQIGKSVGLVCKNSQQIAHARCFDYAVRFYCVCGVTSPTSSSPPESSSTPSTTKSTWSTWSTFTASTTESIWSTLSTRTSTSPTTESTWPRWNTSTPQPSTTTATEGTTTPQGACEDGWTQWININKPTTGLQGGESESLPEIERQLGKICAGGKIEQIQCRDVSVHRQNIGYNTQFGQCSLANGLRCLNKDQAGLSSTKQCYDYEVRFFCRCSPNVCPPPTVERGIVWELPDSAFAASSFRGKDPMHGPQRARINTKKDSSGYGAWTADTKDSTPWIEVQVPEALQFVGLRTQGRQDMHQFVNEFTVEVSEDCRNFQPILGGKPLDANVDQNMAVTNYFSRDLQTVTAKCIRLHPKRFYGSASVRLDLIQCETRSTPTELPTTTASSSISPTTSCYYDDCAMKCTLICHYFDSKLKEIGYCSSNSSNCVPGCKTIDCPDGFYKSRDECVREEQCPCMDDQGREVPPGTIWDVEECKYKICRNNTVEQVIIPGCEPSTTAFTPQNNRTRPYTPSATPRTSTVCEEWTDWINLDNPSTGEGDIETIDKARDRWPGFCPQPISIQCRDSDSKKDVTDIPQELICDVNQGLVCKNEHQYPTKCLDFEVRYFCECFETQTPSVSTRTQSPRTVTQETTIAGETATTKERPTPPTWSTPPPGVCPGVNDTSLCPARCPAPLMCDGLSCVEECPCIIEGRRIKPGHVIKTSDCQLCTCISNGIYHCTPFVCPSCPPGKQLISSGPPSCECECEEGTTAGGSTTASGSPTAGGSSATTSAIFTTSKEPSLTTTGPRGVCVYLSNQTENVYRDANRPTDLIQIELEIGDVRKEGKCRVCICYERSGQEPELVCKDTACPPVRDFECAVQSRAQPGECCPHVEKCRCEINFQGKSIYLNEGETHWLSNCRGVRCERNPDDKDYYNRVIEVDTHRCCIINGTEVAIGEKIPSHEKCYESECAKLPNGELRVQEKQIKCPQVQPCRPGEKPKPDECCESCRLPSMDDCTNCTLKTYSPLLSTIGIFKAKVNKAECENREVVEDLQYCSGYCQPSMAEWVQDLYLNQGSSHYCCQAVSTLSRPIKLTCPDQGNSVAGGQTVAHQSHRPLRAGQDVRRQLFNGGEAHLLGAEQILRELRGGAAERLADSVGSLVGAEEAPGQGGAQAGHQAVEMVGEAASTAQHFPLGQHQSPHRAVQGGALEPGRQPAVLQHRHDGGRRAGQLLEGVQQHVVEGDIVEAEDADASRLQVAPDCVRGVGGVQELQQVAVGRLERLHIAAQAVQQQGAQLAARHAEPCAAHLSAISWSIARRMQCSRARYSVSVEQPRLAVRSFLNGTEPCSSSSRAARYRTLPELCQPQDLSEWEWPMLCKYTKYFNTNLIVQVADVQLLQRADKRVRVAVTVFVADVGGWQVGLIDVKRPLLGPLPDAAVSSSCRSSVSSSDSLAAPPRTSPRPSKLSSEVGDDPVQRLDARAGPVAAAAVGTGDGVVDFVKPKPPVAAGDAAADAVPLAARPAADTASPTAAGWSGGQRGGRSSGHRGDGLVAGTGAAAVAGRIVQREAADSAGQVAPGLLAPRGPPAQVERQQSGGDTGAGQRQLQGAAGHHKGGHRTALIGWLSFGFSWAAKLAGQQGAGVRGNPRLAGQQDAGIDRPLLIAGGAADGAETRRCIADELLEGGDADGVEDVRAGQQHRRAGQRAGGGCGANGGGGHGQRQQADRAVRVASADGLEAGKRPYHTKVHTEAQPTFPAVSPHCSSLRSRLAPGQAWKTRRLAATQRSMSAKKSLTPRSQQRTMRSGAEGGDPWRPQPAQLLVEPAGNVAAPGGLDSGIGV
uniref:SCO-spondin n=1 Tax=Macrostomum lignano TaxID=282301 RepID=A0A1I8GZ93_9PLAT